MCWIATVALAVFSGCGDYSGGKRASAASEDRGSQSFGSATDVARTSDLPTNAVNDADIGIGGPLQRETGNYKAHDVSAPKADEELAKQIKVALTTGSTGTTGAIPENMLTKIDVQVHNGNVTLTGPVSSEDEKSSIGKQVSGFKGVQSVQNNLTVGGSAKNEKPLQPLVPRGGND